MTKTEALTALTQEVKESKIVSKEHFNLFIRDMSMITLPDAHVSGAPIEVINLSRLQMLLIELEKLCHRSGLTQESLN